MHSRLSHDSVTDPAAMVKAAERLGLIEICFTDHFDRTPNERWTDQIFTKEEYDAVYGNIASRSVKIRRGVEFGLLDSNVGENYDIEKWLSPDFVIGSVHYAEGEEVYQKPFWEGRSVKESFTAYLLEELKLVRLHRGFDVLGHLNYACKTPNNPSGEPLLYPIHKDIIDEILKTIVDKGIGLEVNTSGKDKVGMFLPDKDILLRYRELGGEIVTVGSDSHDDKRVGQYAREAAGLVGSVFGYVCTFEARCPIYHKI